MVKLVSARYCPLNWTSVPATQPTSAVNVELREWHPPLVNDTLTICGEGSGMKEMESCLL